MGAANKPECVFVTRSPRDWEAAHAVERVAREKGFSFTRDDRSGFETLPSVVGPTILVIGRTPRDTIEDLSYYIASVRPHLTIVLQHDGADYPEDEKTKTIPGDSLCALTAAFEGRVKQGLDVVRRPSRAPVKKGASAPRALVQGARTAAGIVVSTVGIATATALLVALGKGPNKGIGSQY